MSLQNYLASLGIDQLKELHSDLSSAGLAFESHRKDKDKRDSWKQVFIDRRLECSGKRKKLYSALAKAKINEINNLLNVMVTLYPGLKH